MARFSPVDDRSRVWQVQDLLPAIQADEIVATDWNAVAAGPSDGQESWSRRQIAWNNPVALRYSEYINACLPEINRALGTEFKRSGGHFWIDLPGFTCALHTDGHLANSMQLYWTVPGNDWGTGFYRHKRRDSLFYQFASVPNTGYLMLNHRDPDGSQPLQWHAMLNPVPVGHIRVSSYWQFN